METVNTILSFLWLGSMLVFPQLLGVLLFFLLKGRPHLLAHSLSFLVPVVLTIFFTWMIYIYGYYRAHPDERCGLPLLGGLLIVLLSGCLQLLFGAFAQVALHSRTAICARRSA